MASKKGVSIIILNDCDYVLLQLRDDKPGIDYPGCWGLIGGGCGVNEPPEEGIRREVKEEIGLNINNAIFFYKYYQRNIEEYVYVAFINQQITDMKVNEGQAVSFMRFEDLDMYKIRDDDLHSLKLYQKRVRT